MIDPGTFCVVTLGRRFLRFPGTSIVGGQVAHAARFTYEDEAVAEAVRLRDQAREVRSRHKVGVLRIRVEAVPLPPEDSRP